VRQAKAVGSDFLAERLRRLQPALHVFAHSHFAWDCTLGGTRYVQAPLCYPSERVRRGKSIRLGLSVAAWQRQQEEQGLGGPGVAVAAGVAEARDGQQDAGGDSGVPGSGEGLESDLPLLIYVAHFAGSSGGDGGGSDEWHAQWAPPLEAMWSNYYQSNPRQPLVTTLAPWVAPRFERRRQRLAAVALTSSTDSSSDTEAG
jgi:hypothetical protein